MKKIYSPINPGHPLYVLNVSLNQENGADKYEPNSHKNCLNPEKSTPLTLVKDSSLNKIFYAV